MGSGNRKTSPASLKATIVREISKYPIKLLANLLRKKAQAVGAELSARDAHDLANQVFANRHSYVSLPSSSQSEAKATISITDDDLITISKEIDAFKKLHLPKLVDRVIDDYAEFLEKSLRKDWGAQKAHNETAMSTFRVNLEQRWGKAFDALRMILEIAREMGADVSKRWRRSSSKSPALRFTLLHMHVRACQVTAEVICLVENGYADGAVARWRTLHEIRIIASFIAANGEELAERYLAHAAVENKRAMDRYAQHHTALRMPPPVKREVNKVERAYAKALKQFGDAFGSEYGWASKHLNHKKPRFIDIEASVGHSSKHPYYRMASQNVHATAKGLIFRLGLLDSEQGAAIAGASNTGFGDPAYLTAQALIDLTFVLLGSRWSFNEIAAARVLISLLSQLEKWLGRAQRRLNRDHERTSRPRAKRKIDQTG